MTGPSGPPRIGEAVFDELSVECEIEPAHVIREEQARGESIRREQYRVRVRLFGASLSAARAEQLARLFDGGVTVVPRTLLPRDPGWATETAVDVEAVSPVNMTTPANRRSSRTGEPVYAVEVEAESVATYSAVELGLAVGAFERVASTEDSVTIEPVEGATLTPGTTYTITPASGDPFDVETVVLGDARTAAARTLASDAVSLTLQTREPAS